jgi:hypothetical protein
MWSGQINVTYNIMNHATKQAAEILEYQERKTQEKQEKPSN